MGDCSSGTPALDSLKGNEKGGGKGRAWQESRGGRKHKTIKEKNPAQAWGGLGPQALQAKLGWDIRGSPGVHTAPSPSPETL